MPPPVPVASQLDAIVDDYRDHGNVGLLIDRVRALADASDIPPLKSAAAQYDAMPEVTIPVFEAIVRRSPEDAQALVVLGNAYWLTGRGPAAVAALADKARGVDPGNRGAWHLWALAEPDPRGRMGRWALVAEQFPADKLARAALADGAAGIAQAEGDGQALELAINTYEGLLADATDAEETTALRRALEVLRSWKF